MTNTNTLTPTERQKFDRERFRRRQLPRRPVIRRTLGDQEEQGRAHAVEMHPHIAKTTGRHSEQIAEPHASAPRITKKQQIRVTLPAIRPQKVGSSMKPAGKSIAQTTRGLHYQLRTLRWRHLLDFHFWLLDNAPFPGTNEAISWRKLRRSWRHYDHQWGWAWRAANGLMALVIFVSLVAAVPPIVQLLQGDRYQLTASTLNLVGNPDKSLANELTYDVTTQTYQFNKAALTQSASASDPTAALLKAQAGSADKSNTPLYAVDVPQDFAKGVTYHDTNTELSFSLIPHFTSLAGKQQQGHIIYPLEGNTQAVYTLKGNGLQEDLVIPKATSDQQTFTYSLNLPNTLAARMIPGSNDIGIYSADPSLYGAITYGSDSDRAKIMKARTTSPKTNLLFGLPAPVIKDAKGLARTAGAHFVLQGSTLSVVANGLKSLKGAFTIDPSVVVTSTSDFSSTGNNDSDINFPSGQINRANLSGGTIGAWGTPGTDASATQRNGSVGMAYDGYFYMIGGLSSGGSAINTVYYAAINSNGTMGTWTLSGNTLNTARYYHGGAVYNGYLYVYGGYGASSALNSVEYAPLNPSTGAVGTWTTSAHTMGTAVCRFGYSVYNDYLYAVEGANGSVAACGNTSGVTNNVQYAAITATGDVGTWSNTTTSLSTLDGTGRHSNSSVVYNGYLYTIGGTVNGTGGPTTVYYGKLSVNGNITTWSTAKSLPASHYRSGITVMNGYIYLTGGGSGGGFTTDTLYAPINADGSLGSWNNTSTFSTGRWGQEMTSYNGYIYINGGTSGTVLFDTQYAKIDPAGMAGAYTTSGNAFTTTRRGGQEVAYNGYLYVMGGDNGGVPVATVYRATISNTDGTISAFSPDTSFTTARTFFSAVAYNGYMYVLGGCNTPTTIAACTTAGNDLATVYKSTINASTGALSAWTNTNMTAITTARYGMSTVVYNGYMYVMGGLNGSTFENDIQYHAISPTDGSMNGAWTSPGATYNILTAARAGFATTVYGGYVYLAGGCSAGTLTACTTVRNDVQYAQFSTSGGLTGAWSSAGTSFTTARFGQGLVAANRYLYLMGGLDSSGTYYGDTQFAQITSSGTLASDSGCGSTWCSTGSSLSTNRYGIGAVAYNGFIYVAGGYNGTTYYSDVQIAPINDGGTGTPGTWVTNGTSLAVARTGFGTAVYNGYIYVVGGCTINPSSCGNTTNSLEYAAISSNGSLGSWTNVTTLPYTPLGNSAVAYNGYLYEGGGYDFTTTGVLYNNVYSTPLNPANGSIGSWTAQTSLTDGVASATMVVNNGYIYDVGGYDLSGNTNLVQYAQIGTNGTLGTWSTTTVLPSTTSSEDVVINNNYMYVLSSVSTTTAEVYYAAINTSNGTVGSWTATTSSQSPAVGGQAVVYDGYIYLLGGTSNSVATNTIQYAPINANGTLGNWNTSNTFSTAREGQGSVAYNGFLYVIGGDGTGTVCGGTVYCDVQYAPINAIPRIGHYSDLVDLGTTGVLQSITYNGTLPNGTSAINFRTASPSTPTFGSLTAASSLTSGGGGGLCDTSGTSARYVLLSLTLDDSYDASFSDSAGADANVTDFTINYAANLGHPPPNIRLRGGASFVSNSLLPLDTCGS